MRTTVRLDDHLLAQAKELAAKSGKTLTAIIEEALRAKLATSRKRPREKIELPTFRGALMPGVDLDNSAALLDLMEQPDDSA